MLPKILILCLFMGAFVFPQDSKAVCRGKTGNNRTLYEVFEDCSTLSRYKKGLKNEYIINKEIDLGFDNQILSCSKRLQIDGRTYYISSNALEMDAGQAISIPAGCVLLNESKQKIISYNNSYISDTQQKLFVASITSREINCKTGRVYTVDAGSTLVFKGKGRLKNGIVYCDGVTIKACNRLIFDHIILYGNIRNKYLPVEWFGCNTENAGEVNSEVVGDYLFPSAYNLGVDIYHSNQGTYLFSGSYPVRNYFWTKTHSYVMDFNGMKVYGRGKKTIIQGVPIGGSNPADVFNLVDVRNIKIHDLSVTAIPGKGVQTYGTNAFSLIHNIENVEIQNCNVYNMPFFEKEVYPDGGKAYTIQATEGTSQRNIRIIKNTASNVSYGLDFTKTERIEDDLQESIIFEGNTIRNAVVGCVIHQWDSPIGEHIPPVIVTDNSFFNCQLGVVCQTCKGAIVRNNTIVSRKEQKSRYYDGNYGIYLVGAYDVDIVGNDIKMKKGTSLIKAVVYSYYPQYNGSVNNINIQDNILNGNVTHYGIDIGSNVRKSPDELLYKNVCVNNNINKTKGGQSLSSLANSFLKQ